MMVRAERGSQCLVENHDLCGRRQLDISWGGPRPLSFHGLGDGGLRKLTTTFINHGAVNYTITRPGAWPSETLGHATVQI